MNAVFPSPGHNHAHCVNDGLARAEEICAGKGARLTPRRRAVLELLLREHRATGAYELMDRLDWQGRRPAVTVIYRALEFLASLGLVHRITSLNAFIACPRAGSEHGAQFLICADCGRVAEMAEASVNSAITRAARQTGFHVQAPRIEIMGLCPHCADHQDSPDKGELGS